HRAGGGPGLYVWDRNKRSAVGQDDDSLVRLAEGADVILVDTASPGPTYDTLLSLGLAPGRPAAWVVLPPYLLHETPWAGGQESAGLLFAWLGHAWNQGSLEDVPVDCLFPVALYMQGIWAATTAIALLLARQAGRSSPVTAVCGGAHGGVMVAPGVFV